MKVIELLSKIANGEEVPEKFKIKGINRFFHYNNYEKWFDDINDKYYCKGAIELRELNDEVEVIEENNKEDNKIEKLDTWFGIKPVNGDSPTTFKENAKYIDHNTEMFFEKINEIIDKVNKIGE